MTYITGPIVSSQGILLNFPKLLSVNLNIRETLVHTTPMSLWVLSYFLQVIDETRLDILPIDSLVPSNIMRIDLNYNLIINY